MARRLRYRLCRSNGEKQELKNRGVQAEPDPGQINKHLCIGSIVSDFGDLRLKRLVGNGDAAESEEVCTARSATRHSEKIRQHFKITQA